MVYSEVFWSIWRIDVVYLDHYQGQRMHNLEISIEPYFHEK